MIAGMTRDTACRKCNIQKETLGHTQTYRGLRDIIKLKRVVEKDKEEVIT
jgi:hypothetical protein